MTRRVITTDRLLIREMEEKDCEYLFEIFSDKEAMKYYPMLKDRKETVKWIQWTRDHYKKYGFGLWIVEEKDQGEFLGQCGLVLDKIRGSVEVEIGYLFARKHWGMGYATEAARACKTYGFEQLKLLKLLSLIDPKNQASINVAKRIGMKREKQVKMRGRNLDIYTCYNG
ncbi:GNAT family N-acetyltransferase [Guptibacillus hwajinpoensis]|uniref:RimJ/RimL family protein N-acetyltransferase n=1 Tax=Guptibacillus hwajinpoensis TaxID=208199 RepID=A0ABU0K679_9BACL|nr:GNAT family N-acetyltransferase [Alkalihalobacillus hemicentroti]MDQ0483804.1 RimJ/RimL family protein N-acetyltransferase [Alkalihalobacillus hemicentroti]